MGDIIVLTVIAVAVILAAAKLRKDKRKAGCCGNCGGCARECSRQK